MVIYYILLIYFLILGIPFCRVTSARAKKTYLVMAFSVLFFLMAFRAETMGRDAAAYHRVFNKIAKANDLSGILKGVDSAPVYCLLAKLVSCVGDYRLMLIVTAFIILGSSAIYIYNFSDNAVISTYCFVVLYFYLSSWNISRQFLAVALFLLALCFRKERKYAPCVIFFSLSVGVHNLAAIALPLLIIDREHLTTKKFTGYMTASTAGVLIFSFGFSTIVNLFCLLFPRYRMYLAGNAYMGQSRGAVVFLALFYFLVAVMAVVIQSNKLKRCHLEDDERSHLRYLTVAVTVGGLMGMLNGSFEAMARALHFYQIHAICLIPNAFGKLRRYPFYYPLYYGLLLILLVPFTISLQRNHGSVVPYTLMW